MVKQFHDTPPRPCKYPSECIWIDSHGRIRDEETGRGVDLSAPYSGAPIISCPWPNTPKEQQYWGYVYSDNAFPWQEGNYLLTESKYLGCGIYITEASYPMHTPFVDENKIVDEVDGILGGMK